MNFEVKSYKSKGVFLHAEKPRFAMRNITFCNVKGSVS